MSSTYNKLKSILLSEKEIDFNIVNNYLKEDYKETIDIIFKIFYDSITTCTYDEINIILYNIEEIIDNQSTEYYKIINNKVREINYKLSKLNINTIEFKNIKLTLIDLNRKMKLKEEKENNFNKYNFYSHIIFKEKNIEAVKVLIKYENDILKVVDQNENNIFYNILEHFLNNNEENDIEYFYDVIIIFLHSLEEKILKDKNIYLEKLSKHKNKKYVKEIMNRIKDYGKIDSGDLERKYHITTKIHDEVMKELTTFKFEIKGRKLINSNFITIDDKEAMCLDDTISLSQNKDGSYNFYVGITDIPSLIPYKSKTFYDALSKIETIYLIDKNIDLYHPSISNKLCSLLPYIPKNVIIYKYLVDPSFNLDTNSLEIIKGVIEVNHRLTYDDVDKGDNIDQDTIKMLEKISLITSILKGRNSGKEKYRKVESLIKKVNYHPSTFADKSISANIVQESMLLVNSTVPKYFSERGFIYTYRNQKIHNKNVADKVFSEMVKTYDGNIPDKEYQKMVNILSYSYLNAYYSIENLGHEGLCYNYYSHSSSAARRFIDSFNQYLTYLQLFEGLKSDEEYYELENTASEIVDYINDKKRENLKFQNEYNYLYSKGKILERRK